MLAAVIPARRMPALLELLDYKVPEKLTNSVKIGQLVEIPLRGRGEYGIVYKLSDTDKIDDKIKILPINAIIAERPLLSTAQLEWLKEMAEFYKTPLGFLLKMNLLPLQKNKLKNLADSPPDPVQTSWTDKKFLPPELLIEDEKDVLRKVSGRISLTAQTLILTPGLADIKKIFNALPGKLKKQAIIFSSDLSVKDARAAWLQIWRARPKIIVGTRAALFLPWMNLTQIIMTNEADFDYKSWDMAPRFHTRDAALFLARHHQASFLLIDHTPSVDSWFFAAKKIYARKGQIKTTSNPISIINLSDEKKIGNYSSVSGDLRQRIHSAAGDVFLLAARTGSFTYTFCRDCSEAVSCPRCQKPLVYRQTNARMFCRACRLEQPTPPACSRCQGHNFKSLGAGIEETENELKKNFSDRQIIKIEGNDKTDLKSLKSNRQKIIVATATALAHINWTKIELAAILDADTGFAVPEYKSLEKIWVTWRRLLMSLNKDAELLIQTAKPDREFFSYLSRPEKFYAAELAQRKKLHYPPYAFLLKIFAGFSDQATAKTAADKVVHLLTNLTAKPADVKITGPLPLDPFYRKNKFWEAIIVKIPYAVYKKITILFSRTLPPEWKTDPNPNNLLSQ